MIKTLLSIRMRAAFASMQGKRKDGAVAKPSAGRAVLFAVLYLYVAAVFLGLFTMVALSLAPLMIGAGLDSMYFGIFILLGFSLVFIFSIFETKSELFDCKDNELLLSMPIDPKHIVISRTLAVLVYNYLETAAVMLPAIVVYAVFGGSAVGVVGGTLVYLLLPLLATALASGVGYVVAAIGRRTRRNSFVTTVVSLIAFLIYFVVYFGLMDSFEALMEGEITVIPESPVLSAIGSAATLSPVSLLILAVVSVGSAYLAWKIISANYITIATDKRGAKRVEYRQTRLERRSGFEALCRKELRAFFSSSTYMLNSALGVVFTLILSFVALFNRAEIIGIGEELSGELGQGFLPPIMIVAIVIMNSMNMASASALSLEGKNLWILKSMPISARSVLLSKTVPHIVVTSVPGLLSSVLLAVACDAPVWYWPFFILTPIASNIFFAFLGIALNVAFPKLEFENEAQPIKQSMSVFLSMITTMLWSLALIGVNLVLAILGFGILAAIATFSINCIAAAILYAVICGPCVRKYEKL